MPDNTININSWGEFSIKNDLLYHWNLEDFNLLIKKENNNLKIAHTKNETFNIDELVWKEWLLKTNTDFDVSITPVYPDKMIVLKFTNTFNILKKQNKVFYIEIPIWIKVKIKIKDSYLDIITIPVFENFKGWFGDLSEGQLCYYIDVKIINKMDLTKQYCIKLPLTIVNNTENESLQIEKIPISPKYLSIFHDNKNNLYSDEINVIFKTDGDISIITSNTHSKTINNNDSIIKEITSKLIDKKIFSSINLNKNFTAYNLPIKK
jgi:hypothetical protein